MLFNLALSEEYGRDYFVKGKDMTLFEQVAIKLMVPLQIPLLGLLLMKQLRKVKKNILTKNKH